MTVRKQEVGGFAQQSTFSVKACIIHCKINPLKPTVAIWVQL